MRWISRRGWAVRCDALEIEKNFKEGFGERTKTQIYGHMGAETQCKESVGKWMRRSVRDKQLKMNVNVMMMWRSGR